MKYYVATFAHTNWFGLALSSRVHKSYLKALVQEHYVLAAGPFVKAHRTEMELFVVDDRHKLEGLLASDPYAERDLIASSTINEWQPEFGSVGKPEEGAPADAKYFVVTYDIGDKANIAPKKGEHTAYLKKLVKANQLRVGGSYKGTGDEHQGMYILSVASLEEAQKLADDDPYHQVEGSAFFEINEWDPQYGQF